MRTVTDDAKTATNERLKYLHDRHVRRFVEAIREGKMGRAQIAGEHVMEIAAEVMAREKAGTIDLPQSWLETIAKLRFIMRQFDAKAGVG